LIDFRLNKIIIKDFACYKGRTELDFVNDTNKNIFLFRVLNGHGKTSLFHAIKWGFYGESINYYKDSDIITIQSFLNDQLDSKNDAFSVNILFNYGNDYYDLERTYKCGTKNQSIVRLSKNQVPILDFEDIEDELNNIIPINFADFFMFDGEQLSKFTAAQKEMHYKDSLYQLLGLKQIKLLKEDLETLEKRYEIKLQDTQSIEASVNGQKKIIDAIDKRLIEIETKKSILRSEISKDETILEEYYEKRKKYEDLDKILPK